MNFQDTAEEAAYRLAARAWIAENTPDLSDIAPEERRFANPKWKILARQWQERKADGGYACIAWPEAWGGQGGSPIEETIFAQEEVRAGIEFTHFMTGLQMLLPALLQHTTDPDALALVGPAIRGETIWCQLFSEPSSGSDSAGARCQAIRDGDDWIINGQKLWNSGAHVADYGLLLTRTDPSLPKHKGLTVFWLDMRTPGVEVRPIKLMPGDSEVNEVFLSNVRLSDKQRVGQVGDGWKVVIATLMNERAALASGTGLGWREIMALAQATPSFDGTNLEDPAFREWLADWYVNAEGLRLLRLQTLTTLSRGGTPGPENAAGKLLWASQTQELTNQALDILDHFGVLEEPRLAPMGGAFQHRFLWAPGLRLGGGSDEIMKNIIAERVLGLPGDARIDKEIPFKDVPVGLPPKYGAD